MTNELGCFRCGVRAAVVCCLRKRKATRSLFTALNTRLRFGGIDDFVDNVPRPTYARLRMGFGVVLQAHIVAPERRTANAVDTVAQPIFARLSLRAFGTRLFDIRHQNDAFSLSDQRVRFVRSAEFPDTVHGAEMLRFAVLYQTVKAGFDGFALNAARFVGSLGG